MKALRRWKEREESGEEEDEEERMVMDVRNGWGRIGEPVPRTGVAVFNTSDRTGRYANGAEYNTKDSLEFPPARMVPRPSLANASAYNNGKNTSYTSSALSSSSTMPSSPPSRHQYASSSSYAADAHDMSTDSPTQDIASMAVSSSKRKRDGDGWEDGGGAAEKRRTSPAPRGVVGGAPAKSSLLIEFFIYK